MASLHIAIGTTLTLCDKRGQATGALTVRLVDITLRSILQSFQTVVNRMNRLRNLADERVEVHVPRLHDVSCIYRAYTAVFQQDHAYANIAYHVMQSANTVWISHSSTKPLHLRCWTVMIGRSAADEQSQSTRGSRRAHG